jgi:hypothetical protein
MITNLGAGEFFLILLATLPFLLGLGWLVLTVFRLRATVKALQHRLNSVEQSYHPQHEQGQVTTRRIQET